MATALPEALDSSPNPHKGKLMAIVLNCPWQKDGRCPDDWYGMKPTDDPAIHECPVCGHRVTLCQSRDQALMIMRDHHRVALDENDNSASPSE